LPYWRNSETLFRHALAVTQNNDVAHVDLGTALEQQGRTAEALTEYREAARINPDRPQIQFNLGIMLNQLGRHAESLAAYRAAIRLEPANAPAHSAAGGELVALGNFSEALKEFSIAQQLDPNYAAPHLETAKLFFQQGRDAEAVAELRAALRAEKDSVLALTAAAHYLAANENAAARDGRSALMLALKANELSGRNRPEVFDILGMALAENGDYTNAMTCAQNALELARVAKMKNAEPIVRRLELYKNHQPWRESFRATNAPAAATVAD
jgi:tetratricopeptide (TPR) repeat protein